MCEFCCDVEDGRPGKPFTDGYANAEIQWCARHSKPTLFVYLHGEYTGIEIDHCPKCGRKLNNLRDMMRCTECGEEKPLSEFYIVRKTMNGTYRKRQCKACVKEKLRTQREARKVKP